MEDHQTTHDIIDVTDCLEARDAFKGMKNFCFWLILLSLVVLQGLFWLDRADWIDRGACCAAATCGMVCTVPAAPEKKDLKPEPSNPSPEGVEKASPSREPEKENAPAASPLDPIAQQAREVTAEAEAEQAIGEPEGIKIDWSKMKLPCRYASVLIRGLNFILLIAAMLYCLILLMTLKLSLISRLGGISHISRAFFLSLFMLVFLFPWQCIAPGVLIGSVYLPKELLCFYPAKAYGSKLWYVLMYLRFAGLWLPAIWLLLWSWLRSGKWYRATQRRLGIAS